jgi:hypothetical protein
MAKPLLLIFALYVIGFLLSMRFPRWATFDFRSWERAVFKRSGWDEIVREAQKHAPLTPLEWQGIFRATTALSWPCWVPGAISRRVALRARAARIRSMRRKAARCRGS